MDGKLKLFLEKINCKNDYYRFFEDGKIIKIKSSKDKLNWNFVIETKELLPLEVIKYLAENISSGFSNLNSVTYTIITTQIAKISIKHY